jgi:polysaccharide deacetylase family protein (PEP-CTERM system associated)
MGEAGRSDERRRVLLTVDFEDWYQLAGRAIGQVGWDAPHEEFVKQVGDTLALLRDVNVRATFFVLGITAKNHPHEVERVAAEGHEIACHGFRHVRAWQQTPDEFRRDIERGLNVLESIGMPAPFGYRAPAFSLTKRTGWAHSILAELGFRYDSSHYDTPLVPDRITADVSASGIRGLLEFPIAVTRVGGRVVPIGGGSYWRVLPKSVIRRGIEHIAADLGSPVLYFHPYELGRAPLRIELGPGATPGQWSRAAWKRIRYNTGRARVGRLLMETAERVRFVPCCDALAETELRVQERGTPVGAPLS